MKTIRLVNKLEKIQNLTPSEKRSTAAAFNNSTAIIGCITDYLNDEINQVDKKLLNPAKLYSGDKAQIYVTCILAERARNLELLHLLTEEITVDDDQSGE